MSPLVRKGLPLLALATFACSESKDDWEYWPQPSLLPPIEGPRLGITNSGDDTLSFVDPTSFREIARVPVGAFPVETEGPHHLAATADGRWIFVGISNTVDPNASAEGPHGSHGLGAADGYLLKIDATTGREVARRRVERSPGDIRLEPGTNRVWQSHYDLFSIAEALEQYGEGKIGSWDEVLQRATSSLIVTDGDTLERIARVPVCPAGHGIAFAPDGREAYVSCGLSDEVAIVDTKTFAVSLVPVGPSPGELMSSRYAPYAVTVAPDGLVWASNGHRENLGLRVIDPVAKVERPELALDTEGLPLFGTFTRDGSRLYMVTQKPDVLLAIDPATAQPTHTVSLSPLGCLNAHGLTLSPDESELYVVCEGDHLVEPGSLERFDTHTLEPTGHVELGLFPDDVVWIPEPR